VSRVLSHAQARAFYDRFGAKQDLQRFYENRAIEALLARGAFATARAVVEFGCGTGALARELLVRHLPPEATYVGLDVSSTMVSLARGRVAPWKERARIAQTGGEATLPLPDGSCDRVLSAYVLDLLSAEDIAAVLHDARRVLEPEGLLCLASLTFGQGLASRAVCQLWQRLHALRPQLVGGCRPIRLTAFVEPGWAMVHREVVCALGICTEIVVARP
jgi:ubiquinone/menaquinone biosynthesis C-methylase UbiE